MGAGGIEGVVRRLGCEGYRTGECCCVSNVDGREEGKDCAGDHGEKTYGSENE